MVKTRKSIVQEVSKRENQNNNMMKAIFDNHKINEK